MNINFDKSLDKWSFCQKSSSLILAEGIRTLQNSAKLHNTSNYTTSPGNYLISLSATPLYIGEARNLKKRIAQQTKKITSTFYKNYLTMHDKIGYEFPLNISDFDIQIMETLIGTKEIEEFGIVNLSTTLNKFQLKKRQLFDAEISQGNWFYIQNNHEEILSQGESQLLESRFFNWYDSIPIDAPGIYYVEHKDHGLIYIGESSNIQDRYKTHSRDTRFSALRRHIATSILGLELKTKKDLGFEILPKSDKRMYLTEKEDLKVSRFLEDCKIRTMIISFGRYELESYLIKRHKPLLNVKDNK